MNKCFYEIKRYIQISFFLINLISFIVVTIICHVKRSTYVEYTNLPKISSNIFILIIFLIIICHTIYPKMICSFISDNLNFLMTDRGKLIANLLIGILFWSCDQIPLLVFECINFVSSFGLFLCEFIFQCNILYNNVENTMEEDKASNELSNGNSK